MSKYISRRHVNAVALTTLVTALGASCADDEGTQPPFDERYFRPQSCAFE